MSEYRSLYGLASIRVQTDSHLYDVAFWCNEKGVSSRQQLTLKMSGTSGILLNRKRRWFSHAVMKSAF